MRSTYYNELFAKMKLADKQAVKDFMAKQPKYDNNQVNELIHKIQRGDVQAKEQLIDLHKALIQRYLPISPYKDASTKPEDKLMEAANKGLIKAAIEFDVHDGYTFFATSIWYINRCMLREILDI